MKIKNKQELQKFLELNIGNMVGSYALATYEGKTYPLRISNMGTSHGKDGSRWYLESPIDLHSYPIGKKNRRGIERAKMDGFLIRENVAYDLDSPQVPPFLPDSLDDFTLISKKYCLEWILTNNDNDNKK